jgi:hypothetical protein
MQADYIVVREATCHALWACGLGISLLLFKLYALKGRPVKIFCNYVAIFFAKKVEKCSASENINMKYFAVSESVRDDENHEIEVIHNYI